MSKGDKVVPINVPERNLTTSQQVGTLINVCGMFWSMLQGPLQLDEGLPKAGTAQGESRLAAEQTFIKACDALQGILDDRQRWDFSFQKSIEDHFAEAAALNRDFLLAQREAAEENASPHFRWQPTLNKLVDGTWAAILGDPEHGIYGVGKCPAEALAAFDAMFYGEVPESVKQFIKNHEQQKPVDGNGSSATENPPAAPGNDPGPDSGCNEQKPGSD